MQQDIFDIMYEKYIITKPIRLIELFAGYGSQALALNYLGVEFEHYRVVEFDKYAIQSYNEIHGTNFKTKDITKTSAKDLGIIETNKYEYIMTYSFPCQDLSLAGKRAGMSDTSTRSGLLWEVERILDECTELPQILLMENVPQVIGTGNVEYFNKWQLKLESLGYKNYHQNLIATDYGIPQTRNRTFMISILGDYSYTFPQPIPLKLKLKDMLEENVDEKYYLSDKQLNDISNWNAYEKPLEHIDDEVSGTLTTRSGAYCSSMKLVGTYQYSKSDNFMKGKNRFQQNKNTADTLQTTPKEGVVLKIPEATKKGYAIASAGDSINLEQPNSKTRRGRVGKGVAQTLMTNPQQATIDNLRIRKLTPRECFRLMGVRDEDYEKITCSNAQKYKQAGNSIVVNVLMAIFKELLRGD